MTDRTPAGTTWPGATLRDVVHYAGASGDDNPIHYDPAAGGADGTGDLFVMGMLTAARLAAWLERAGTPLRSYDVRFTDRVWLGQALTATAARDGDGVSAEVTNGETVVLKADGHFGSAELGEVTGEPVGPSYPWTVERGAVRDFLRASGGTADWRSLDAAPITFVVTAHRWAAQFDLLAALGFDNARMLHGSSHFRVSEELTVGTKYRVEDVVANRQEKQGRRGGTMRFADVVTTVRRADGGPVAQLTMRLLELPTRRPETASSPGALPAAPFTPPGLDLVDVGRGVLLGSRDPATGDVFFPRRALAVDGSLRETEPVDLAPEGALWAVTSMNGHLFGEVVLDDGVHMHSRLLGDPGDPPVIGERVRVSVTGPQEWVFDRV